MRDSLLTLRISCAEIARLCLHAKRSILPVRIYKHKRGKKTWNSDCEQPRSSIRWLAEGIEQAFTFPSSHQRVSSRRAPALTNLRSRRADWPWPEGFQCSQPSRHRRRRPRIYLRIWTVQYGASYFSGSETSKRCTPISCSWWGIPSSGIDFHRVFDRWEDFYYTNSI